MATAPGALIQADNAAILRENIVESRRGYASYLSLSNAITQLFVYSNKIIAHNGTTLTYDNSGSPANYSGTYSAPTGYKMRSVEAFSNAYITTSQGVQVLTDTAGTAARLAGAPRPLDATFSLTLSSGAFLSSGCNVAYRFCILRTDANGNAIRSYPSGRYWVGNPSYATTGNTTNGSTSLTSLASTTGIQTGMTITGSTIPLGTTVSSIVGSTVTMSQAAVVTSATTTANTTNGSNQLTSVASTLNISVGMNVTGTGIPANTVVVAINNITASGATTTDITLSQNATATGTGISLTFAQSGTGIAVTFGTAATVTPTIRLPADALSTDVLECYRTAVSTASGTADTAGDEMALVYQVPCGGSSTVSFTDILNDALRGATLYTSPSQETITQANERPPLAKDIALFRNDYLFYANTSTKQRQYFSLVAASPLVGTAYKFTVNGVDFSFSSSENAATGTVAVSNTGIVATDIDATARSLVRVINAYASNTTVYASYLSGPSDVPGQIMLEERGVGGANFSITVSNAAIATAFVASGVNPPTAPATSSQWTSTNQVQKNGLFFSKAKQPEAVPSLNYYLVGAANKNILRIVALRESLIVVKEEGVYRLTGMDPSSFLVSPLDLTVFCKSPDSVAVLSNTVIMLSNQGVVQISDTGAQVISREIEPALKSLLTISTLSSICAAAGYESERTYFLSVPTVTTDTVQTQTFAYNIFTRTWTRYFTVGFQALVVEPGADKLYLSKPSGQIVYRERKAFDDTDYADPEAAITISSINTAKSQIVFTCPTATPSIGWKILQGSTDIAVSSISSNAGVYTATLVSTIPGSWTTGAATIYPPVGFQIQWDLWFGGQPNAAMLKQVSETAILVDPIPGNNTATALTPTYKTNFDENQDQLPTALPGSGWGGSWGSIPWGGSGDSYGYRNFVPRNKQMCRTMNLGLLHQYAREKVSVAGCAFLFEPISERIGR